MRSINPALQASLDSGATKLCACWRIDRTDGVSLGFTDHDRALRFDGLTFEAASAVTASAGEASLGLAADNAQIEGALASAAITARDIAIGRYDGAQVRRWLVDWTDVTARTLMFRGTLGEIARGDLAFTAEVEGLAAALNQPIGRAYLPTCDAELGDARCGVDVDAPAFGAEARVIAAADGRVIEAQGLEAFEAGWFARGKLTWVSGANAGLIAQLRADTVRAGARMLELWLPAADAVAADDAFRVVAGCDKRFGTCRGKFGNVLNFRGFPHMPGDDWATSYPASGGANDGGSLNG